MSKKKSPSKTARNSPTRFTAKQGQYLAYLYLYRKLHRYSPSESEIDEHFYEFQFGNGPHDPKGKRYVLPEMLEQERGDRTIAGDVTQTTIDSLGLKVDQPFGYWFDYGDDWWHQIDVQAIDEKARRGKYPKVIKRVGKSPPQYVDEED